jgi:G3E family GTPase
MDKKLAGLLGAVAGLATITTVQAATTPAADPAEALAASSYADLLAPISNPAAVLQADNAARAKAVERLNDVELAQAYYYPAYSPPSPNYRYNRRHHHHHHHHAAHHHHHHHHNAAVIGIPGVGGVVVGR